MKSGVPHDELQNDQSNDDHFDNEKLLQFYLSLPKEERNKRFANTSAVATMIGKSQRTVQFWIETGAIQAVPIGKSYQVSLDSLSKYLKSQVSKKID